MINKADFPIVLDRKDKLKPYQAVTITFLERRLFNHIKRNLCECVVKNPGYEDRDKISTKLDNALTLNTENQSVQNLKKFLLTECPFHAKNECDMKPNNDTKSLGKYFC